MLALLGAFVFATGGQPQVQVKTVDGLTTLSLDASGPFRSTKSKVSNLRVIEPGDGPSVVILWKEQGANGSTPYYAVSLEGGQVDRVAPADYNLQLRYKTFDPINGVPTIPGHLKGDSSGDVYIVQFVSQSIDAYIRELENAGAKIDFYLPEQSYIVHMDAQTKREVQAMPFVRWVGRYEPAYRVDEGLRPALDKGTLPRQRYNVMVYEWGPTEQKASAVRLIESLGGKVDFAGKEGYIIQATLTSSQVRQVLKLDEVFFVDLWGDLEPDMDIARQLSGANYIEATPENYKGQGVRGQVRDGGVRATHQAFLSPPLTVRSNTGSTSHGTSTYGIVFGNGAAQAAGRGLLPSGNGIFIAGLPTGVTRFNETAALLQAPYFGCFESNSTGSPLTTAYTSISQEMDDILFRLNVVILQSQSNAGSQSSRPQAWGKNMVSVGGISHQNTLTTADDVWTSASHGPAADGRIKPDLAHFYDNVFCPTSTSDTAYTSGFNGTSSATPITAGHFGLFFQMWADGLFGQTVTTTTVFDARPWNTLVRAMMINTASQWTLTAVNTRYRQGWGRADVKNLYDLAPKMFYINESDVLTNLQSKTYRLYVKPLEPALKVTMVYTDVPGTVSSTQHRINDLTLKVVAPDGTTTYWGNNGLVTSEWSTSGGVANNKDVVENVYVQNPAAGIWTVTVSADQINQDARLETTTGPFDADYSLIATGVSYTAAPSSFAMITGSHTGGVLGDMVTSNNKRVVMQAGMSGNTPLVHYSANVQAPTSTLTSMRFRIETNVVGEAPTMTVSLLEHTSGNYIPVLVSATSTTDNAIEVDVPDPNRFLDGSGNIVSRVKFDPPTKTGSRTWTASVDQMRWMFTP